MSSYVPTDGDVAALLELLGNGLSGRNSKAVFEQLQQYQGNPSFCTLLAHVYGSAECPLPPQQVPGDFPWESYRRIAGLTLKNNIELAHNTLGDALAVAARSAISVMSRETSANIVHVACQIVARITSLVGFDGWKQLDVDLGVLLLGDMLSNGGKEATALLALKYLLEDATAVLGGGCGVIVTSMTKLVERSADPSLQLEAFRVALLAYELGATFDWQVEVLSPLQQSLLTAAPALAQCATLYVQSSGQSTPEVRLVCVAAFTLLVEYLDALAESIDHQALQGMLQLWLNAAASSIASQSPSATSIDGEVASTACEFFSAVARAHTRSCGEGPVQSFEQPLVAMSCEVVRGLFPLMLMSSEEEQMILSEDHYTLRDTISTHAHVYTKRHSATNEDSAASDNEPLSATLRTAAFACLNDLVLFSPDTTFPAVIDIIGSKWNDEDWRFREVVIVALGASYLGCSQMLEPMLPQLVPQLQITVRDAQAHVMVVSSALWTLMMFTQWMFDTPERVGLVRATMEAARDSMMSHSKRVQNAALTLLRQIILVGSISSTGQIVQDAAPTILEAIQRCLPFYHTNNLGLLCDVFVGLVPSLPHDASTPLQETLMNTLLPQMSATLQERYGAHNSNVMVNKDAFDVARAIADLLIACPNENNNQVAAQLLDTWVEVFTAVTNLGASDDPELLAWPLDLSEKYINAVNVQTLSAIHQKNNGALLQMATYCIATFKEPQVRHSACTLIETLLRTLERGCVASPDQITQSIAGLIDAPDLETIVSASFVLAELCRVYGQAAGEDAARCASSIAQRLRSDTYGTDMKSSPTMQSLALSIGATLLHAFPSAIAPNQLASLSMILSDCGNDDLKVTATQGVAAAFLALQSRDDAVGVLPSLLRLVYSWQQSSSQWPPLFEAIRRVLFFARDNCGDCIAAQFANLPQSYRAQLMELYQLQ